VRRLHNRGVWWDRLRWFWRLFGLPYFMTCWQSDFNVWVGVKFLAKQLELVCSCYLFENVMELKAKFSGLWCAFNRNSLKSNLNLLPMSCLEDNSDDAW